MNLQETRNILLSVLSYIYFNEHVFNDYNFLSPIQNFFQFYTINYLFITVIHCIKQINFDTPQKQYYHGTAIETYEHI